MTEKPIDVGTIGGRVMNLSAPPEPFALLKPTETTPKLSNKQCPG